MTGWGNNYTDKDKILELEDEIITLQDKIIELSDEILLLEQKIEGVNRIINY